MNRVFLTNFKKKFERQEKIAESITQKALRLLGERNVLVEIILLGDKEMKSINKRFRGKNKTADVLSFKEPDNFPHPEYGRIKKRGSIRTHHLGEIYLNLQMLSRKGGTGDNKREELTTPHQRMAHLLIHGLLHLLGYNHERKSDRIKMEKKEKILLPQM